MLGRSIEMMLHETARPGPVTFTRPFPKAESIKCFGGLYPPTKFGCTRPGKPVRHGVLPINEACGFQVKARHGELKPEIDGRSLHGLAAQFPEIEINSKFTGCSSRLRDPLELRPMLLEGLMDQIKRKKSLQVRCTGFLIRSFMILWKGGNNRRPSSASGWFPQWLSSCCHQTHSHMRFGFVSDEKHGNCDRKI